MNDWKESPLFAPENNYHEVEIQGTTHKFWAICPTKIFKLRRLATPIAQALMAMRPGANDVTIVDRDIANDGSGGRGREIITEGISPQLAKLRFEQQEAGLKSLIESLTDEANAAILGELIMDSMREVFPRTGKLPAGIEVVKGLQTAGRLLQVLRAIAVANAEVIDPLVARVAPSSSSMGDAVKAAESAVGAQSLPPSS